MHTKRGMRFEIKDGDKGTFVAVFSTLSVKDHDGDVTLPGAFDDGAKMPVSAYNHASWSGKLPVGKAVIKTTDKEAQAHGQFFTDTQDGHDTFMTVKRLHEDGIGEWSYGYDTVKFSFGDWSANGDPHGPKENVRFLEKLKVHEVSPVLVGAGIGTYTVAAKGVNDGELEQILRSLSPDRRKSILDSFRDDDAMFREALRFEWGTFSEYQRFANGGR